MNFDVQLYILDNDGNYQRADLFPDETIELVDSIQNLRDPAKFFSEFTKSFSIPASARNNNIFRHFYEADIINGFDGRIRVDAEIRIGGIPYKEGQVRLESAKITNGYIESYELVFYGATSKIKENLSDSQLDALFSLSRLDHAYTGANVKDGFEVGINETSGLFSRAANPGAADIVYPFISHTSQYILDDDVAGNIYALQEDGSTTTQLRYQDLKPAIKVIDIIDAIDTDILGDSASIDRTGFLAETTFSEQIWLWLHRLEGGVIGEGEFNSFFTLGDSTYDSVNSDLDLRNSLGYFDVGSLEPPGYYDFTWDVTVTGTGTYDILVTNALSGAVALREEGLTGASPASTRRVFPNTGLNEFYPSVKITSAGTITVVDLQFTANRVLPTFVGTALDSVSDVTSIYDWPDSTPVSRVSIVSNMPQISCLDFLTGIFKMYNLTIQRRGSVYYIETLDDFYASGSTIDITDFVDESSLEIKPSSPFDKINMEFEESESFLLNKRRELVGGTDYGNEEYEVGNVFEDNEYDVSVPFEKILFERMTDISDDSLETNMWAWSADDSGDPYVGAPVLFHYDVLIPSTIMTITWEHDGSTSTQQAMCSNTVNDGTDYTLTFGDELGEYTGQPILDNLFTRFWQNYITGVYGIKSRILNLNAYLPASFLTSYSLADTIVYKNKEYFINELTVDVTTGEANIELITKWL